MINKALVYLSGRNRFLILFCMLALYFCFWKLGADPLNEWDESRRGVNAMEMTDRGDLVNMYYAGQPDTWNAKPPMMVWLIALSFKLFGFNEFALRFPAALAIFISFIVLFRIITLYADKAIAFFTCLILLTVNGLVGNHTGRTGDTDALLILFLLLSIFHFLRYTDFSYSNGLYYSALFLGLAFYTKGFASLIILPGLVIYLLAIKKFAGMLKDRHFWIAAAIFSMFVLSWIIILYSYGLTFTDSVFGSSNTLETLWKYDIIQRFTTGVDNKEAARDFAYFFKYLDINFNLWNYLFYVVTLFLLFRSFINKNNRMTSLSTNRHLLLLSVSLFVTIGLLLTFTKETHIWYMAPALPFIAIYTTSGIRELVRWNKYISCLVLVILLFTFTRKAVDINSPGSYPDFLTKNETRIRNASQVIAYQMDRQDYFLYLKFRNSNVIAKRTLDNHFSLDNGIILISKEAYEKSGYLKSQTKVISGDEMYLILEGV